MVSALATLVILVLLLGFGWWAIQTLIGLVPLAEPFKTIMYVVLMGILVIIVVYALIYLLGMFGVHVALPGSLGHMR